MFFELQQNFNKIFMYCFIKYKYNENIIINNNLKMCYVLVECLEHLTSMVEDYGTSVFQPSVAVACKEIAKSIGDRDNSVRTAALNCFVAAFFLHGEALFNFVGHVRKHFINNLYYCDKRINLKKD